MPPRTRKQVPPVEKVPTVALLETDLIPDQDPDQEPNLLPYVDTSGVSAEPRDFGSAVDAENEKEFPTVPIPEPREPKAGIPDIDEWMDFFSRVVLRLICDWYVSWCFRGIDEDVIEPRDIERLRLTREEKNAIARPLAEMSNKSKFMRRHGRRMIATAQSLDSVMIFGAWASRVSRISRKYRKMQAPAQKMPADMTTENTNGFVQSDMAGRLRIAGTTGGAVPNGFHVVPGNS